MNNDSKDILTKEESNNHERLNDLNDALNSDELMFEKTDADFEKEAAEGLQQITGNKIPALVNEINRNLRHQLKNKKRLKKKNLDQSGIIITIITLLLLIVLGYIIIKKFY